MRKPIIEPVVGPRSRLRPLAAADLPMTLGWRNRDDVRCWFAHSAALSWDHHAGWFANYLDKTDDFLFVIEDLTDDARPVGQVGLYHVDRAQGAAEFGRILIGEPRARGRGFAREATGVLLGFAFRAWGLRTVRLEVFPHNERAIRIYRDCGFEPAGRTDRLVQMQVSAAGFESSAVAHHTPAGDRVRHAGDVPGAVARGGR